MSSRPASDVWPPGDIAIAGATLCGVDLGGFSSWLDAQLATRGDAALEAVADEIAAFLGQAAAALRADGFELGCLLGDGLIAVRRMPLTIARPALQDRLAAKFARIEPSSRIAVVSGDISVARLAGWNGREDLLLTGPAVDACHRLLPARRHATRLDRHALARPRTGKLIDADIEDAVIAFVCLRAEASRDAALAVLRARLPLWQAEAAAQGGRFERVTHDDTGYLVRFGWTRGAITESDARRFVEELAAGAGEEVETGTGVAAGLVFRAGLDGLPARYDADPDIVQGPPVNRAAKQAKQMLGGRSRSPAAGSPDPVPAPARIYGRKAEIDLMLRWQGGAPGSLARLVGDPGVGKSHLLRAFAEAVSPIAHPIIVAAEPRRHLDWLGVWFDAIDALTAATPDRRRAWTARCAAIVAEPGHTPPARLELYNRAIIDLLTAIAADRATVVIFDDLQWADGASSLLIRRVCGTIAGLAIAVAVRTGCEALLPEVAAKVDIRVGALDEEALEQVVRGIGGAGLNAALPLAGGNAFHAIQLALSLREGGGAASDGSIAAVIDYRLAHLPPGDRALLRLLAIADRPLAPPALAALAAAAGLDATGARIADLTARAMLTSGQGRIELSHRALLDRVSARTPLSVQRWLHGRTAVYLRTNPAIGVGRGEIGRHWWLAGKAARAAISLGRDADAALAAGDFDAAIVLFGEAERALRALPEDLPRLALAIAGRGMASWGKGDVRAGSAGGRLAQAVIDQVFAQGRTGSGAGRRRRLLALALGRLGRVPARLRLAIHRTGVLRTETGFFRGSFREVLLGSLYCVSVPGIDKTANLARARGMGSLAVIAGLMRLPGLAMRLHVAARAMDPSGIGVSFASTSEAIWRFAGGDWLATGERLDEARSCIGDPGDPQLLAAIHFMQALLLCLHGQFSASLIEFDALQRVATRAGSSQTTAWALYGSAMPLLELGRHAEAETGVNAALALLADNDDFLSDLNCHGLLAQIAWARDDTRAALDQAAAGIALAARLGPGNFGSITGFSAPALVITDIARAASTATDRSRATAMVPAALKQLRRYARVCPIGRPRLKVALALAASDDHRARWHARSARTAAEHLRMVPDIALTARLDAILSRRTDDARLYPPAR